MITNWMPAYLKAQVVIKFDGVENTEDSGRCCAADEEDDDGDENQDQHPLLCALQSPHPPPPRPRPELKGIGHLYVLDLSLSPTCEREKTQEWKPELEKTV